MKLERNLYQIRAEVLLNYLYPEMEDSWLVQSKGTFYRNYNQDLLELNLEEHKVQLARDGFMKLLPEGLLTKDTDLKGEDVAQKFKELEWRKELLTEAFAPFDTYVFYKKLTIERYTSELLEHKLEYVLKTYFDFDLASEPSPLVREAAVLLPFVNGLRGDFGFISSLLGALMDCEVEHSEGRYSDIDTTLCWLPEVRYRLLIPGLTAEEYRKKTEQLQPLIDFVKEWLIPFEVRCDICIREHPDAAGNPHECLTLNYNTELSSQTAETEEENIN
jgi:hypothetical protein